MNNSIAIIGGGWSGVYALKYCLENNLDAYIYEKNSNVGGVWFYDKEQACALNKTTYASSSLIYLHPSDFPYPEETPNFPHHSIVQEHLQRYIDNFNLRSRIFLNTPVNNVEKKGNKWEITIVEKKYIYDSSGNSSLLDNKKLLYYDKVIVCSGVHHVPNIPQDGMYKKFTGEIFHSHEYDTIQERFKNKNILIIGGGETANDISSELAPYSNLYVSIRNGQWFQNKLLGAYEPADTFINYIQVCNPIVRFIYRHSSLLKFVLNSYWDITFGSFYWGANGHGVKEWKTNTPYTSGFFTKGRNMLDWISKGKVIPCKKILDINGHKVLFDGKKDPVHIDIIIFCTGYQKDIAFMKNIKENYLPENCFKYMFPLEDSSIAYCGFIRPFFSSLTMLSEFQARYISSIFSNRCKLPKVKIMLRDIKNEKKHQNIAFPKDNKRLKYIVHPWIYLDDLSRYNNTKISIWKYLFTNTKIILSPLTPFHYRLNDKNKKIREVAKKYIENAYKYIEKHVILGEMLSLLSIVIIDLVFLKKSYVSIICVICAIIIILKAN